MAALITYDASAPRKNGPLHVCLAVGRKRLQTVWRRAIATILGGILSAIILPCQENAAEPRRAVSEYRVKAAFLLNMITFVQWPPVDNPAGSPFAVCVVGEDPFGPILDRALAGETVNGRSFVVTRIRKIGERCDLLYFGNSDRDTRSILQQAGAGVLTVGENATFLRDGGMINFVLDSRRVRFDVNLKAVDRASLHLSSRLLSVARAVLK